MRNRNRAIMASMLAVCTLLVCASNVLGWTVTDSGNDFAKAGSDYNYYEQWGYGWCSEQVTSTGSDGIYSLRCYVYCDPSTLGWIPPDTGTRSSDGWRKKTLNKEECDDDDTCSVTFEIDGSVTITGYLCADNQVAMPYGNTYFYGWGKEILSGLANGSAETKASFSGEEGDDQLSIGAGPVNVTAPVDFDSDEAYINGNDTVSSGDTVTGEDQDFIKLRGTVYSRARTWDGGEQADGTTKTLLQTFTLTVN